MKYFIAYIGTKNDNLDGLVARVHDLFNMMPGVNTCIALCVDCHRNPVLGWHGQRRAWAINKMDEIDALNETIRGLCEEMPTKGTKSPF